MSGWVKALFILGVIFIIFGVVQWQEGTNLMVITPAEHSKFDFAPSDWRQVSDNWEQLLEIEERVTEGQDKQTTGGWLMGLGVVFIIAGGMSLIGASRSRKEEEE